MGVLGWPPSEALYCDMRAISLAYEGWCDQRDGLGRIIYRSQGIKMEDSPPRGAVKMAGNLAQKIKDFALDHNTQWRATRRASAKPKARGKVPK